MGRYLIWCPDYGQTEDSGCRASSFDARSAVTEWAEWSDKTRADYRILGGSPAVVIVRDLDSKQMGEYVATGESIPHYSARPRVPA